MNNLITLIMEGHANDATTLVEKTLSSKTLAAISKENQRVAFESFGGLLEAYGGDADESPVFMGQDDNAYLQFFQKALKQFGVAAPSEFQNDDVKNKFFNYLDQNWKSLQAQSTAPRTTQQQPGQTTQPGQQIQPQAQSTPTPAIDNGTQTPLPTPAPKPAAPPNVNQNQGTTSATNVMSPGSTLDAPLTSDGDDPELDNDQLQEPSELDLDVNDGDQLDPEDDGSNSDPSQHQGSDLDGNNSNSNNNYEDDGFDDEDAYTINPEDFLAGLDSADNSDDDGHSGDDDDNNFQNDVDNLHSKSGSDGMGGFGDDDGSSDDDDGSSDSDDDDNLGSDDDSDDGSDLDGDSDGDDDSDNDDDNTKSPFPPKSKPDNKGNSKGSFKGKSDDKTAKPSKKDNFKERYELMADIIEDRAFLKELKESKDVFHQKKSEIKANPNLTTAQKKQQLNTINGSLKKANTVQKHLTQVQQNRNTLLKSLKMQKIAIKNDPTLDPSDKAQKLKALSDLAKNNRSYHKNLANDIKSLHITSTNHK